MGILAKIKQFFHFLILQKYIIRFVYNLILDIFHASPTMLDILLVTKKSVLSATITYDYILICLHMISNYSGLIIEVAVNITDSGNIYFYLL